MRKYKNFIRKRTFQVKNAQRLEKPVFYKALRGYEEIKWRK